MPLELAHSQIMSRRAEPFQADTFYHVYSRAIGEENLFRSEENYRYFLRRYAAYVPPIAATFAYCLMPNHFHLLVRIRSADTLIRFFREKDAAKKPVGFEDEKEVDLSKKISQQFGNWLNAYAKAFNRRYERRGRLFVAGLRRKQVTNERYLYKLVHYIHANPVHHGFVEHPSDWLFSSYRTVLNGTEAYLERERVLDWFGGRTGYEAAHREPADRRLSSMLE